MTDNKEKGGVAIPMEMTKGDEPAPAPPSFLSLYWRHIVFYGFCLTMIAVFIGVCATTGAANKSGKAQRGAAGGAVYYRPPYGDVLNPNDPVNVFFRIKSIDPTAGGANLAASVQFDFPESLLINKPPIRTNNDLAFYFGDNFLIQFKPETQVTEQTLNLRTDVGSVTDYPFDYYTMTMPLLTVSYNNSKLADPPQLLIVYNLFIDGTDIGVFTQKVTTSMYTVFEGYDVPIFTIKLERSQSSRVYPIFVVLGMWFIMIGMFIMMAAHMVYRFRKVDNPGILTFFSSLIFALPSLRNSMPSAPPLGAAIDIWAFFWAESMAIAFLLLSAVQYVYDCPPAPAPGPVKPAEKK